MWAHAFYGGLKKMKHKKIRLLLFIILLLIVSIICFYEEAKLSNDYTEEVSTTQEETTEKEPVVEEVVSVAHTNLKDVQNNKMSMDWDSEDAYLLAKIAMAEAEGESLEGKALVILVVLNRLRDNTFPDTVEEVILQHSGDIYQFSPVANGRFYNIEPSEECWEALAMVKNGWDKSQGALYFESCKGETWHTNNLEYLFEVGGHQFYK